MSRAFRSLAASLLILLAFGGCASGFRLGQLPPASTPEQRWRSLHEVSTRFTAFSSHSRIRITTDQGVRSFAGRVTIDRDGRFRLIAYSPAGTTAATLFIERNDVVFIDHVARSYWRGPVHELEGLSPLLNLFATVEPARLGRLLFGLPSAAGELPCRWDTGRPDAVCISDGVFEYAVTTAGIAAIRGAGIGASLDPPGLPPDRVTVIAGTQQIEMAHLDVIAEERVLAPPVIGPELRCCIVPSV